MVQRAANTPIRFGLLPELIGYRLRLAQLAVFKDFCEHVGGAEMTPTLFGVLALVEANPGMTQAQLAEAIQLDRSSIVSILDKLEARGLVERRRAPNNRRSNALRLTADGEALVAELLPEVHAHEQRLVRHLDADEQRTLRALLDKVISVTS
ncbi:MAG TPA: MarR family transcriptional regulator [Azoarcus taiwanensis]|nr:MarR family transcriptional regulator [Azoarcus taiwanensis]